MDYALCVQVQQEMNLKPGSWGEIIVFHKEESSKVLHLPNNLIGEWA